MIFLFAAQPGTFLIERDPATNPPRVVRTPVVGWQHVQGTMAFPVTAMAHRGLTHGRAVLHPEGYVTDPTHLLVFETEQEWLAFIKTAKPKDGPKAPDPYRSTDSSRQSTEGEPDTRAEVMPGTEEPEKIEPRPRAPMAEIDPPVRFGQKTFKTKSYWRVKSEHIDQPDSVFSIEGEQPYPKDDRCEKITRDEFVKLKKNGSPVVDPHAVPDENDDDDGMDLI